MLSTAGQLEAKCRINSTFSSIAANKRNYLIRFGATVCCVVAMYAQMLSTLTVVGAHQLRSKVNAFQPFPDNGNPSKPQHARVCLP